MSTNSNLTIAAILGKTVPYLAEKGLPNPRLEADLMLGFVLDLPRVKLYSDWDRPLNPDEIQRYREIIAKRVQGWPMAYLTGKKPFLSWDFVVNRAVLIPRPETEELVEAVVTAVKGRTVCWGADIGTGSGAIGIALAKALPESQWVAVDISPEALEVAQTNAANLEVAERIRFVQGDLLQPLLDSGQRFDLIVSNPPYIPSSEIAGLQPEVRKEPVLALDGGPDGLDPYRRMIPQLDQVLAPEGIVAFEHGADQREPLTELLNTAGYASTALQDLAGLDRIIIAHKSE
ncbi:MAG TPA: peptide chain release factor N(5)-glutamine methyltransferase [Bacillota bacterium]|nr:peptide chain release factor N(5)-glutamine methyltransferase [Bacillota bacterium]